ncbi:MAG TPA: hypothetical protein PLK42_13060, partial [Casimicrobium sp.]|nr:hypothetical protein [Casimicrobium sp.]
RIRVRQKQKQPSAHFLQMRGDPDIDARFAGNLATDAASPGNSFLSKKTANGCLVALSGHSRSIFLQLDYV